MGSGDRITSSPLVPLVISPYGFYCIFSSCFVRARGMEARCGAITCTELVKEATDTVAQVAAIEEVC